MFAVAEFLGRRGVGFDLEHVRVCDPVTASAATIADVVRASPSLLMMPKADAALVDDMITECSS